MFTPPPSPMPGLPVPSSCAPEKASALRIATSSPNPPVIAQLHPSSASSDSKKRTGKNILLFILLLPAAFVLSASLRHLLRIPALDGRQYIPVAKREPQAASSAPTPTLSAPTALSSQAGPPSSVSSSSAVPTVPSTPPPLPTPLPQPFDLTLSSNFSTRSCEAFFNDFTQDDAFRQCRAFSFLLNASSAFLDDQHNLSLFNAILWATCNTRRSADDCEATMSSFLDRLNSDCHDDIEDGNQAALQAQIGFQSFTAMRTAACLTDTSTNTYCYVDAVAESSPADVYFYALPLGTPLPPDTKPSCSPCIKNLLAVYAKYVDMPAGAISIEPTLGASNTTTNAPAGRPLPVLSKTYPAAARVAVNQCGGTYASVTATRSSSSPSLRWTGISWSALLLAVALCVTL